MGMKAKIMLGFAVDCMVSSGRGTGKHVVVNNTMRILIFTRRRAGRHRQIKDLGRETRDIGIHGYMDRQDTHSYRRRIKKTYHYQHTHTHTHTHHNTHICTHHNVYTHAH